MMYTSSSNKSKFTLPAKHRKVAWVHEDTLKDVKKYAWVNGISVAEAMQQLLVHALEDFKNS